MPRDTRATRAAKAMEASQDPQAPRATRDHQAPWARRELLGRKVRRIEMNGHKQGTHVTIAKENDHNVYDKTKMMHVNVLAGRIVLAYEASIYVWGAPDC